MLHVVAYLAVALLIAPFAFLAVCGCALVVRGGVGAVSWFRRPRPTEEVVDEDPNRRLRRLAALEHETGVFDNIGHDPAWAHRCVTCIAATDYVGPGLVKTPSDREKWALVEAQLREMVRKHGGSHIP